MGKNRRGDTYVKWNMGLGTVALSVSNGSRMSKKPVREESRLAISTTLRVVPAAKSLATQTKQTKTDKRNRSEEDENGRWSNPVVK